MKQSKKQNDKTPKEYVLFGLNISVQVIRALTIVVGVLILLGTSLVAGIGIGYLNYLVTDTQIPDKASLEKSINDVSEVSSLAFADGTEFAMISSDLIRTSVTTDEIAPIMKKAVVATEDENFYEHNGWVPKATIRALLAETLGVGSSSGGSTLTQQLVKQQILGDDPTFKRKANEILLATQIEKDFSKDEIITAYLNVSPFGRNNRGQNIAGVEEAAMGIFGVSAKDLNIPQAAFIAGLPQSPIVYSPYDQFGNMKPMEELQIGLTRQRNVLFNMFRNGYITEQEYKEALDYDLISHFQARAEAPVPTNDYLYTTVLSQAQDILARQLAKEAGKTEEDLKDQNVYNAYLNRAVLQLRLGGYKVYSTIDQQIYNAMQDATANFGHLLDQGMNGFSPEVGNVLLDNKTGAILGFVGGRDFTTNQNNYAFNTERSPGSTIKPLLVYGPAIEEGMIGSESMLSNFPTSYYDGTPILWSGRDGTNSFISLREALEWSWNVPAYWTHEELKKIADPSAYMKAMNFSIPDADYSLPSLPMGATEVTTIEQVNGFQTFANGGKFNQAYLIDKIVDSHGNIVYQHESKPVQVFSPATASIMTDLMRTVIDGGTTTQFRSIMTNEVNPTLATADWVGKTGTSDEFRDAWLIISTPGITTGSWIGMDGENSPRNMTESSSRNNSQFMAYLMNAVYQVRPDVFEIGQRFTLDSSVIRSTVSKFTGEKPGTVTIDGKQIQTPGGTITSYWAKNGAPASTYRFGIGGTDANYKKVWADLLNKAQTNSNNNNQTADNEADTTVTEPDNPDDQATQNEQEPDNET
ncbi:MAG: penicillin-binding protein [Streptococcaceae bacterium]|jgi:penicillin-binding protein|nr:penicillin-binding protein [Streptococcaceae bacterium]